MTQEIVPGTNFLKTTLTTEDFSNTSSVTILTTEMNTTFIDVILKVNTICNATSDLTVTANLGNTLVDVSTLSEGELFNYRIGSDKDVKIEVSDNVISGEFIILTELK